MPCTHTHLRVEVVPSEVHDADAASAGQVLHDGLTGQERLRAAEAPEGRVAWEVGLTEPPSHPEHGPVVRVVDVEQAAVQHRPGQVERAAGVGQDRAVEERQLAARPVGACVCE